MAGTKSACVPNGVQPAERKYGCHVHSKSSIRFGTQSQCPIFAQMQLSAGSKQASARFRLHDSEKGMEADELVSAFYEPQAFSEKGDRGGQRAWAPRPMSAPALMRVTPSQ